MGTPGLCQLVRRRPRTCDQCLKWRQSCRTEALTCEDCVTLDSIRIEWNCWTPSWCQRIGCWYWEKKNQDKPITISFTLHQSTLDSKQPPGCEVCSYLFPSALNSKSIFRVSNMAQPAVLHSGQLWCDCPLDTPQGRDITALWA